MILTLIAVAVGLMAYMNLSFIMNRNGNGNGLLGRLLTRVQGRIRGPALSPESLPPPASDQPIPEMIRQLARENYPPIDTLDLTPGVAGTSLNPITASATIKTQRPITWIHGILTLLKVDGTAAGNVQDAVRRCLHSVRLVHGGTPIQTWGQNSGAAGGGQMIDVVSRGWGMSTPRLDPVLLTGADNGRYFFKIPIAVSVKKYAKFPYVNRSALRIGDDTTWRIEATGGTVADIFTTPGTASITNLQVEFFCEVDDTLDPAYPQKSFQLFTATERQPLAAAGLTRQAFRLNQNGRILFAGLQQRDTGVRTNGIVTAVQFLLNQSQSLYDGSWFGLEEILNQSSEDNIRVPEIGWGWIDFDQGKNLNGVPAAQSAGWQILISSAAGAAQANDGLFEQIGWILPIGALQQ